MEKRNTKQIILEKALDLFSIRGYDGVSVKDIANAVGIRDSSLYKHYQSKQEIFEKLMEEMDQRFDATTTRYHLPQGEILNIAAQYEANNLDWLQKAVETMFLFFTQDDYVRKFTHLLMIEQYKNNIAAELFRSWFIETGLSFQTALFSQMISDGYFRKADPRAMAVQFHGPVLLLIMMFDSQSILLEEALRLLRCHVAEFAHNYTISREVSYELK
ncbi:MAG: TetR/AcrR family transcriptional regulator [Christensenella sp.]|nr:TetR/AcrR family transcriptional regulator [Christensenella sp.]